MFGPSEEVRRAQAAEATGLKDIPASNGVYIILIKRQEVQGLSVDMEQLTELALNEEEGEDTYGTRIMLWSSLPGLTRIHTTPSSPARDP